jgi:hypothetical protein
MDTGLPVPIIQGLGTSARNWFGPTSGTLGRTGTGIGCRPGPSISRRKNNIRG